MNFDYLNRLTSLNVGLLVFSAAIVLILIISLFSQKTKRKGYMRLFLLCLIFNFIALISEGLVFAFEERKGMQLVIKVVAAISYIGSYATIVFWMFSLLRFVKEKYAITDVCAKTVLVISIIQSGLIIFSVISNYFFYVDDNLLLRYTDEYFLLFLLDVIVILLRVAFILQYKNELLSINRYSFFLFLILPILSVAFEWLWANTPRYLINTLTIALLYFMYNSDLTTTILNKEKELEESKITIMLSQIQPHFLYNTLTSIASLCDTDPKVAKDVTINFSNYLRGNINSLSSSEMIPFEKELQHIDCYLSIEKVRFKERVEYVYDVKVKDFKVPPLTIQPIVENAVKHGICKKKEGGTIKLSTYEQEKDYVISIEDNGVGFVIGEKKEDGRKHIGLENVESRLHKMCQGRIEIESEVNTGTKINIFIPKK